MWVEAQLCEVCGRVMAWSETCRRFYRLRGSDVVLHPYCVEGLCRSLDDLTCVSERLNPYEIGYYGGAHKRPVWLQVVWFWKARAAISTFFNGG